MSRTSADRRLVWSLPAHLASAAVVLFAVSAWVGFDGYFFIDEAAIYAQLEALEDGDWVVPRPLSDLDPSAGRPPMANSFIVDGGFVPFAKHPVHVLLARAADWVAGGVGVRALSTFGVVVASGAAAMIARPHGQAAAIAALWLTAFASPLTFDAQLVVAHALAAAVAGVLLWRVLATRRWWFDPVVAFALGAFGTSLRTEFVLLVGSALAVVAIGTCLPRNGNGQVVVAIAAAAGAAVAYIGEPLIVERLVGGDASPVVVAASSRGGVSGAFDGLWAALVRPALSYSSTSTSAASLYAVGVFGGATALLLRCHSAQLRRIAAATAAVAIAAAVVHLLHGDIVPGLLWAFPALWLLAGVRRDLGPSAATGLAVATLFGLAVLGTQYSVAGGGFEWGWRYFAIAVPAVTPAIAVVSVDLWRAAREEGAGAVAFVAVAAAFLLVSVSGLVEQRKYVSAAAAFLDRSTAVAAGSEFVVTSDSSFGRFAYPLALDGRLATAPLSGPGPMLRRLAADGVDPVLYVDRGGLDVSDLGPYQPVGEPTPLGSGYEAVRLALDESNIGSR